MSSDVDSDENRGNSKAINVKPSLFFDATEKRLISVLITDPNSRRVE